MITPYLHFHPAIKSFWTPAACGDIFSMCMTEENYYNFTKQNKPEVIAPPPTNYLSQNNPKTYVRKKKTGFVIMLLP